MAIRIVLADDHGLVRAGVAMMIKQQSDMEVVGEAENGRSTVELAKKLSPNIVLMDISMPDLDGIDCDGAEDQIAAPLSPGSTR